jgi:hypothetical protein
MGPCAARKQGGGGLTVPMNIAPRWGAIVRGAIVRGAIVWGAIVRGAIVRGAIVWDAIFS